jgi:hypothetical protein
VAVGDGLGNVSILIACEAWPVEPDQGAHTVRKPNLNDLTILVFENM